MGEIYRNGGVVSWLGDASYRAQGPPASARAFVVVEVVLGRGLETGHQGTSGGPRNRAIITQHEISGT
jgi:hypothetical protein